MNVSKRNTFQVTNLKQNDEKQTTVIQSKVSLFKGFFYAALSGIFFASSALLVKYLKNLPPEQLTLLRFMGTFFLSLPTAARYRGNIFGPRKYRLAIFFRCVICTIYILLSYITFRILPIGAASTIVLSTPAIVAILAKLFLKEPCGLFQVFILMLTVVGVSFTAKLPAILEGRKNVLSNEEIYGILAGIGAVTLNSCQVIIVRKLKDVDHIVMMFNLGWIAILVTAVVIAVTGNIKWHKCGIQGWLIVLLALLTFVSQIFIIFALQSELATSVMIVRSSVDIVVSFIFQVWFFKDIPEMYGIIGATLLGISFILSGIRKWASGRLLDSPKFKCLKAFLN